MIFCETDQIADFEWSAIVKRHAPIIVPEHLMDFAEDDAQVCFGSAVFKGSKRQIKAAFVIGEMPGLHIIARLVIKADSAQFMDTPIQDDRVLGRFAEIAKAHAEIEPDGLPIGQET